MLRTLHYTDEAIGYFFELARKQPWYARTVFVLTGDHGLPIAPLDGLRTFHRFIELRHRVPLIIFSPLLQGGKVVPGPASQIDLLPTLSGLFGVKGDQTGLGRDLLDPATAHALAVLEAPDPLDGQATLVFAPDGESLFVMASDGAVTRWNLRALHRELANLGLDW